MVQVLMYTMGWDKVLDHILGEGLDSSQGPDHIPEEGQDLMIKKQPDRQCRRMEENQVRVLVHILEEGQDIPFEGQGLNRDQ